MKEVIEVRMKEKGGRRKPLIMLLDKPLFSYGKYATEVHFHLTVIVRFTQILLKEPITVI